MIIWGILNRGIVAWGSEIQAKFCHLIMYVTLCICAGLAYIDDDQHICVLWIHQPSLYSMYITKKHLYIILKFVFSQIQFFFNQYFLYKNIPPKQKHNFGICIVILKKHELKLFDGKGACFIRNLSIFWNMLLLYCFLIS